MFSGIVEETAQVVAIEHDKDNIHITMKCSFVDELKIDQSVAHNGVCLTVVRKDRDTFTTTAMRETLERSNLGLLKPGSLVNLERSMMMNGRLDGPTRCWTVISCRGMSTRLPFVQVWKMQMEAGIIRSNIRSTKRWRSRDI